MLKKSLMLGAALALAASSLSAPSFGEGGVIKVNAPIDHQFKFGAKRPKHRSEKQTAWYCYTPGGTCYVPYLGGCCCQFWWGYYCGTT